jgi:hypothetical protein
MKALLFGMLVGTVFWIVFFSYGCGDGKQSSKYSDCYTELVHGVEVTHCCVWKCETDTECYYPGPGGWYADDCDQTCSSRCYDTYATPVGGYPTPTPTPEV